MRFRRHRIALVFLAACLVAPVLYAAEPEPDLTEDQKIDFLLHAKVIDSKPTDKGVTSPWKLTLTDGKITHYAFFQAINESKPTWTSSTGRTEINFRDYWGFNVAGYRIARMLGLGAAPGGIDLVPIYVERKWNGNSGSLCWGVAKKMDEVDRKKQNLHPPDVDAWNNQMWRVRVLTQLLYDTDPNMTNLLIGENWKVWRIDFTRAFRQFKDVDPKELGMCDRNLLAKLRTLDEAQVMDATKGYLSKGEIKSLMARRDKIVQLFDKKVKEEGEEKVLY